MRLALALAAIDRRIATAARHIGTAGLLVVLGGSLLTILRVL
ncbi:hypothetical protein [Methylobacterium sp. JK268]